MKRDHRILEIRTLISIVSQEPGSQRTMSLFSLSQTEFRERHWLIVSGNQLSQHLVLVRLSWWCQSANNRCLNFWNNQNNHLSAGSDLRGTVVSPSGHWGGPVKSRDELACDDGGHVISLATFILGFTKVYGPTRQLLGHLGSWGGWVVCVGYTGIARVSKPKHHSIRFTGSAPISGGYQALEDNHSTFSFIALWCQLHQTTNQYCKPLS